MHDVVKILIAIVYSSCRVLGLSVRTYRGAVQVPHSTQHTSQFPGQRHTVQLQSERDGLQQLISLEFSLMEGCMIK